jgi:hypothetical protein
LCGTIALKAELSGQLIKFKRIEIGGGKANLLSSAWFTPGHKDIASGFTMYLQCRITP